MRLIKLCIIIALMAPFVWAETEYGTFYEQDCSSGRCTMQIYTTPQYYQMENGTWQRFSSEFANIGCRGSASSCILNNLYEVHIRENAQQEELITYSKNGVSLSFSPKSLSYTSDQRNVSIGLASAIGRNTIGNRFSFNNLFLQGINLSFAYTPFSFKEEITIENSTTLPRQLLQGNGTILFETEYNLTGGTIGRDRENIYVVNSTGDVDFYMPRPFMRDARGSTIYMDMDINATSMIMRIPIDWLFFENRSYPIVIDPTLTLNHTQILFDGHISFDTGAACYDRYTTDSDLAIGSRTDDPGTPCGSGTNSINRGAIEFDIRRMPTDATIQNLNLTVYIDSVAADPALHFKNLVLNSTNYLDNNEGNSAFFIDMQDGVLLNSTSVVTTAFNSFNLTSFLDGLQDFENAVFGDRGWWLVGISNNELDIESSPTFISSEESILNRAPTLTIEYNFNPKINLTRPDNLTTFYHAGEVQINWTINSSYDPYRTSLYGFNQSGVLDRQYLLYYQESLSNFTSHQYEWNSPQFVVGTDTQLLYRFDNISRYGENDTVVYDYAGFWNGTPELTYQPNYENAKFGGSFNASTIGRVQVAGCRFDCYRLMNRTYMTWLKPYVENNGGAIQGVTGSFFASSPNFLGFTISQYQDQIVALGDGLGGAFADDFFVNSTQQWVFLAVTTYENGTVSVYKDGVFHTTGQISAVTDLSVLDPFALNYQFYVGEFDQYFTQGRFNGEIDEFITVNSTLEPDQILNQYQLGEGIYYWQASARIDISDGLGGSLPEELFQEVREFNITISPFMQEYQGEILVADIPDQQDEQLVPQRNEKRTFLTQLWGYISG